MSLLSSLATPGASTATPAAPFTTATPGTITATSPVTIAAAPGARYMASGYYSPYNTLYTQYPGARYVLPSGTPATVAGATTIPSTTVRPGTVATARRPATVRPAAPYRPYQPAAPYRPYQPASASGQQEQGGMGNMLMYSLLGGGKKNRCSYRTAAQGKKSSSNSLLTLMMLSDTFAKADGGTDKKQMKSVFNYIDRRKHCKSGSDDLFDLLKLRGDIGGDMGGGLAGLMGMGI